MSEKTNFRFSIFFRSVFLILAGVLLTIQPVSSQKRKAKKAEPAPVVKNLVIADKGESRYRIVVPAYATPDELKAAEVLQDYLLQISDAALPVISVNKSGKGSPYEIILGQNERLDKLGIEINFNELGEDGFVIKTDSLRLIIAGGSKKGTLYGVYTFLEKYLDCRMYAPGVKIVPHRIR